VEETKLVKPTDKAIVKDGEQVTERNESELRIGLEKNVDPEAESSPYGRRQLGMGVG